MATAKQRGIRALVFVFAVAAIAAGFAVWFGSAVRVDASPEFNPVLAERDPALAWLSRILLVLSLLWIAIGAIATRTSLVRRPGAAATRSTWLSSTRPWRSRESMLGLLPFDRALMIVIPAGLLVFTRLLQVSFVDLVPALTLLLVWVVFAVGMILLIRPRSPWPVIATVGGVIILSQAVELIGYAVAGPHAYWLWLWSAPMPLRVLSLTISWGLLGWTVVAAARAAAAQVGVRRATSASIAAAGMSLVVVALVTMLSHPGQRGVLWNDGIIAVQVPSALIFTVIGAGLVAAIVGSVLARQVRPSDPQPLDAQDL